ncbi:metalloregulator ArsR/SmtB family transcription factor [Siccirubricoccus sp. KC 17139]|uniref:Metalloregulator ArsR/SmtB family transcription factor n=1 Tax=Siccirubricoccus soli TaxID=2899147 RepID=A0ABT1D2K1_9PROT|nr:metalloregulator ArsR/SmtB family transcription factor [Siccirubricoccus soli]MCO6416136.1 metalloregulator ArsR/SmtB family transcription factor [Siccirubricoccus soli]MCP2682270.1 metalloregulator ArsR/SmtB family transcription factor [Siccirubricoccus soli]
MIALADPTRRAIFELVVEQPRSVSELARALPVSQPAVSQHLKVLRCARLVGMERRGASNVYHLDPYGLAQMRAWLDGMWAGAFDSFKAEVEKDGKGGT